METYKCNSETPLTTKQGHMRMRLANIALLHIYSLSVDIFSYKSEEYETQVNQHIAA